MKFKCNSNNCRYEFFLNISEEELDKLPTCPLCKDKSNLSYRIK